MVTYQDPQTKYSKSIITESLVKIDGFINVDLAREIYRDRSYRRNSLSRNYLIGDVPGAHGWCF
jgi:hypothetical protein